MSKKILAPLSPKSKSQATDGTSTVKKAPAVKVTIKKETVKKEPVKKETAKKETIKKSADDKPAASKTAAKAADNTAPKATPKTAAKKAPAAKAVADQPADDRPVIDKPIVDKLAAVRAVVEDITQPKASAARPAKTSAVEARPAEHQPAEHRPVAEKVENKVMNASHTPVVLDAHDTSITFASLNLAPAVLEAVLRIGYETPSPIQAQSIPLLLAGHNLLGTAQTGTAKTAAFALPLLSRLDVHLNAPQMIVICPTRELAIQVAEACSQYASAMRGFHVLPIYGGQDYSSQLRGLKRGPQVVVGTPGRILDHLRRGSMKLDTIKALVLDEADEMLRMGFIDDIEAILAATPANCQRALFSATMPAPIRAVAERYLPNAKEVRVANKTATVATTEQFELSVYAERKLDALTRILEVEDFDAAIIFVRTKAETLELSEKLSARGHSVAPLSGDLNQRQREQTVEDLKKGRRDIVIATDVAARGLDVPRITHVINYDMPYDAEAYIHRIGRTGRAGRVGRAITLVTPRERSWLRTIERATRSAIPPYDMPSPDQLQQRRLTQFEAQLLALTENESLVEIQTLLHTIAEAQDLDISLVAAALARWLESNQPGTLPLRPPADLPLPKPGDSRPRSEGDRRPFHKDRDRPRSGGYDKSRGAGAGARPERTDRPRRPGERSNADRGPSDRGPSDRGPRGDDRNRPKRRF